MITLPGLQRHSTSLFRLLTASGRLTSASVNTRYYKTEAWQLKDSKVPRSEQFSFSAILGKDSVHILFISV